jgi:hypothetical protein
LPNKGMNLKKRDSLAGCEPAARAIIAKPRFAGYAQRSLDWSGWPMGKIGRKSILAKKAKRGFRGYPVATVAFYGPTADSATKVAVGIVRKQNAEPDVLERWFSSERDVRTDTEIQTQVLEFIQREGALSVAMTDTILGCPHEEGIDYPEGEWCPKCPYWRGRDRFSGERLH